MRRHSLSLFWISNVPAASTSAPSSQRSPASNATAPAPASNRRRFIMIEPASIVLAPQLLEPRIASAIEAVEFVADWILQIVVLVIVLGLGERTGRHDFRLD